MSPRAAWRLESLGFTAVYDYVAGKADWFARGLPRAGRLAEEPTVGQGLCVLCSCCWRTTATGRYAYKRAGHLRPSAYLGPVDGRIRCSA